MYCTWENKTIDHDSYRELILSDVLPAIVDKWPIQEFMDPNFKIRIQQDGAGGHCSADDREIHDWLVENGEDDKIELYTQPANSPGLNICDLGLFAALQALHERSAPKDGLQLVDVVLEAH